MSSWVNGLPQGKQDDCISKPDNVHTNAVEQVRSTFIHSTIRPRLSGNRSTLPVTILDFS